MCRLRCRRQNVYSCRHFCTPQIGFDLMTRRNLALKEWSRTGTLIKCWKRSNNWLQACYQFGGGGEQTILKIAKHVVTAKTNFREKESSAEKSQAFCYSLVT